jgi:hypothetical protein
MKYLVKVQKQNFYFELLTKETSKYRYLITAFDRLHNESQAVQVKL